MKIHPVGAELFHADKHDKANSRFSKFCKRTYNTTAICKLLLKFKAKWSLSFTQCSIVP